MIKACVRRGPPWPEKIPKHPHHDVPKRRDSGTPSRTRSCGGRGLAVYSLKIAAGYALNIEPTGNSNTRLPLSPIAYRPNFSSVRLRCSSRALIVSSIEKRAASARALSGSATAFSCPSRPINARWRLRDVPLQLVEMTKCDLFIHKRKTSLGTRCSTLPGSLRCWCYERIMGRAAAPDMGK